MTGAALSDSRACMGKTCITAGCERPRRALGLCGPCRKRTPEYRAYEREYNQRPEVREKRLAANKTPERRDYKAAKRREYYAKDPEKFLRAEYNRYRDNPKYRAQVLARSRDPRVLAKRRAKETGMCAMTVARLRELQKGLCAICVRAISPAHPKGHAAKECADHAESLNGLRVARKTPGSLRVPRSLLCASCNLSLGIYEKHQRDVGFRIDAYEAYLALHAPPEDP